MKFDILSAEEIINAVKAKKAGAMFRLTYKTELPVKAAFKKLGIRIIKITHSTVRCGVDYDNIASVIERKAAEDYKESIARQNNYSWVLENRILFNNKTNNNYIRIATVPNHSNTTSEYITITDEDEVIAKDFNHDYVINSYFTPKESAPVKNIKFENIIGIN